MSWWDGCLHKGKPLRRFKQKRTRTNSARKATAMTTTATAQIPKRRRAGCSRQLSLRPVGRPVGWQANNHDAGNKSASLPICAQYWNVVDCQQERQLIPMDFVRNNYSHIVLSYDRDENGFVCKCGQHVSLANRNYRENIKQHCSSSNCVKARQHKSLSIKHFFRPAKQYERPDPAIICRGFWAEFVTIDGKKCRLSLLGEYANSMLYYISGRTIHLRAQRSDHIAKATRSVHSVACLGHALDQDNNLRPSRTCLACSGLVHNKEFRRMLLQAQDPARFQSSHKLPDQFYSWKHLQVCHTYISS